MAGLFPPHNLVADAVQKPEYALRTRHQNPPDGLWQEWSRVPGSVPESHGQFGRPVVGVSGRPPALDRAQWLVDTDYRPPPGRLGLVCRRV